MFKLKHNLDIHQGVFGRFMSVFSKVDIFQEAHRNENAYFNVKHSGVKNGKNRSGFCDDEFIEKPLVTIVTVVFNGASCLEKTIQSVLNQSYHNVEYIVIDGGSADGTVDIIKSHQNRIKYWESNSDSGIYDAMNKGIRIASGEWINFLNAGDVFYSPDVLFNIFNNKKYTEQILYGDLNVVYKKRAQRLRRYGKINPILYAMPICHQTMFVKSEWLKKYPFNLVYAYASDFDNLCKILKHGGNIKKVPEIIASIDAGGVSDTQRHQVYTEYKKISGEYYGYSIYAKLFYFFKKNIESLKIPIKKIFNI